MLKRANNLSVGVRNCHRHSEDPARRHANWAASRGKHAGERRVPASAAATSPDVREVLTRVASMADREVRERYHQIVDERQDRHLTALERFELERIEARLDAEDRDPQIEARNRQWELERTELLESIEDLLVKLRR